MSLDFDVSKLADQSVTTVERDGHEYWSEPTQCVVFATMSVGINRITEENYEKFFQRYVAINMSLGYPPESNYVTLEMVRQHIGLSTNASTYTDAEIKRRVANFVMEQSFKQLKKEQEKAAEVQEVVDLVNNANPWNGEGK